MFRSLEFWVGFLVGLLVAGVSVYATIRLFHVETELAMLLLIAFLVAVLIIVYRVRPVSERAGV